MLNRTFKFVYVSYKDGLPKPNEAFTLVTDIQYYNDYIVIEYYKKPDKVSSTIIMTTHIAVEELSKYDAEREWVKMNNAICGHNFTQMKFWPFEGKKSDIEIYPLYGGQDGSYLLYTNILGIERKWNHDIEKIVIVPEEDIKKFIIKRSDHEDLVINVNGGTYRDE